MAESGEAVGPEPRWSRRDVTDAAAAVVVVAIAAVVPVLLCVVGWHQAQTTRGVGAGRGVFTVASCGDRREETTATENGTTTSVTYTCTGTFDGRSGLRVDASVSSHSDHRPGARTPAYVTNRGSVHLASRANAAMQLAAWFTAACTVALLEAPVVWRLSRWIRVRLPIGLDETDPWWSDLLAVGLMILILAPALALFWLWAFLVSLLVFIF